MRKVFYSLEDYFEALAEARTGRLARGCSRLMSFTCAILGDAIGTRMSWSSLFPSQR